MAIQWRTVLKGALAIGLAGATGAGHGFRRSAAQTARYELTDPFTMGESHVAGGMGALVSGTGPRDH
jgi:hypothetical protein